MKNCDELSESFCALPSMNKNIGKLEEGIQPKCRKRLKLSQVSQCGSKVDNQITRLEAHSKKEETPSINDTFQSQHSINTDSVPSFRDSVDAIIVKPKLSCLTGENIKSSLLTKDDCDNLASPITAGKLTQIELPLMETSTTASTYEKPTKKIEISKESRILMTSQVGLPVPSTVEPAKNSSVLLDSNQNNDDIFNLERHKVLECESSENGQQLRVIVKSEKEDSVKRICMLRDTWLNTAIQVGDVVYIHANWYELWDENDDTVELAILDRINGLIVVKPDLLVSGTTLVSSLICRRKAILAERFRRIEPKNRLMISGTLVHRLFQKALISNIGNSESLHHIIDDLLSDPLTLHDLYGSLLSTDDIKNDMESFIPAIQFFVQCYVEKHQTRPNDGQSQHNQISDKTFNNESLTNNWSGTIESICDIEDNFWSPQLGLKGKVDVTVKVNGRRVPLELKTGRPTFSPEHIGQLTLYSMLMDPKFPYPGFDNVAHDENGGLLLYLSERKIQRISVGIKEKQGLMQLRNELVNYLLAPTITTEQGDVRESRLPLPIDRKEICASCPFRTECAIYQIAETIVEPELMKQQQLFTAHLTKEHQKFFVDWSLMLRLEQEAKESLAQPLSDIWCLPLVKRRDQGRCLPYLEVQDCRLSQQKTSELSQFIVTLVPSSRTSNCYKATECDSFQGLLLPETDMQPGDNVILSSKDRVALANGSIVEIKLYSITIATDRDITNTIRQDIHLDKLDYRGDQSLLYTNLSHLMAKNHRASRLRRLVIDLQPPKFKAGLSASMTDLVLGDSGRSIMKPLNQLQQRAVLKALVCQDYCLIDGLPGTGKTSLIVALIRLVVLSGQTVFLTSYTHSAVDNVLIKLLEMGFKDFIRLGRSHRINSILLPYSSEYRSQKSRTVQDIERLYSAPVIAATCLSVGHPAISIRRQKKPFDFCIVDEAAQTLQLAIIGPLTSAKRFVLVGDPRQLPPVVQSKTAKRMGMDESLFQRLLSSSSPGDVISLRQQYRMCSPLNTLANKLCYAGDLLCANEEVELATLLVRVDETNIAPWLPIRPGITHSLVFLDTSLLGTQGQHYQSSNNISPFDDCVNILEANLVIRIVSALSMSRLEFCEMGIIAPYQSQIKYLNRLIQKSMPGLEINTVDQYQGRDKSVIVYSCTKACYFTTNCHNSADNSSEQNENVSQTILHDLRRLTVAVTRAKHKLIIIGQSRSLRQYPPFVRLLDALEPHQYYQLRLGKDGFSPADFTTPSIHAT